MCHLKIINHKWCRRIVRVPYKIPCTRVVVLLVASYYLDWYKVWRCGPACFPVAMLQPPKTEPGVSDHLLSFLPR